MPSLISALEQLEAVLAGYEGCIACGGPVPGIDAEILLVDERQGEPQEPPTCEECGLMVDSSGKCLPGAMHAGQTTLEGITIH